MPKKVTDSFENRGLVSGQIRKKSGRRLKSGVLNGGLIPKASSQSSLVERLRISQRRLAIMKMPWISRY